MITSTLECEVDKNVIAHFDKSVRVFIKLSLCVCIFKEKDRTAMRSCSFFVLKCFCQFQKTTKAKKEWFDFHRTTLIF